MKLKLFLSMLAFSLCLTACADMEPQTRELPAASPAISSREAANYAFPVELTEVQESVVDGGETLATCSYQLPEMRVTRLDGGKQTAVENARNGSDRKALAVAETFNSCFHEWMEETDFDALAQQAREDRALSGERWQFEYHQGLENTAVYASGRLVSVSGTFYYYGGGAHPNTVNMGWNFDTQSGSFFSVAQLFDEPAKVTKILLRQAAERAAKDGLKPEEFFWPDYADILSGWEDGAVSITFDAEDMIISYSPYDLASYAAGPQIFRIPRASLSPYLNEYGRTLLQVPEGAAVPELEEEEEELPESVEEPMVSSDAAAVPESAGNPDDNVTLPLTAVVPDVPPDINSKPVQDHTLFLEVDPDT